MQDYTRLSDMSLPHLSMAVLDQEWRYYFYRVYFLTFTDGGRISITSTTTTSIKFGTNFSSASQSCVRPWWFYIWWTRTISRNYPRNCFSSLGMTSTYFWHPLLRVVTFLWMSITFTWSRSRFDFPPISLEILVLI